MEKWKNVQNYEEYEISNLGRVRSIYSSHRKTLNYANNGKNYLTVCLYKDKKQKRMLVHRLVALHFLPNFYNKPDVNHKDGNKSNNSLYNLEWVTKKENIIHGFKLGLFDNSRKKSSERMLAMLERNRNLKLLNNPRIEFEIKEI